MALRMRLSSYPTHIFVGSACTWLHVHADACPDNASMTCMQCNICNLQAAHEQSEHLGSHTPRTISHSKQSRHQSDQEDRHQRGCMGVSVLLGTLATQTGLARKAWVVSGWRCMRASRKSLVFWHDAAPLVGPGILRLPGAPYALGKTSSLAAAPTSHAPISLVVLRPVVLASVRRG